MDAELIILFGKKNPDQRIISANIRKYFSMHRISPLSLFSVQRKTAIRKYQTVVQEGFKNNYIRSQLNNQIYLGDEVFVQKVQRHMCD
jgi:hypothetical protein